MFRLNLEQQGLPSFGQVLGQKAAEFQSRVDYIAKLKEKIK
jgi:hypothetical protein